MRPSRQKLFPSMFDIFFHLYSINHHFLVGCSKDPPNLLTHRSKLRWCNITFFFFFNLTFIGQTNQLSCHNTFTLVINHWVFLLICKILLSKAYGGNIKQHNCNNFCFYRTRYPPTVNFQRAETVWLATAQKWGNISANCLTHVSMSLLELVDFVK